MKKVLIVGVNHCWQQLPEVSLGSPSMDDPFGIPREITDDEFTDFDGFIRATIEGHCIRTVVEEACGPPHLRICGIAAELGVVHKYCEISKAERERRGIKTTADRETHWLSILANVQDFPVLMICGATHVESFSALLAQSDYEPVTIAKDYEQRLFAT